MEKAAELPVGIVGAGTMGAGIAQVALAAGHRVLLYDPDEAALQRARARIADGLGRWATKRISSRQQAVATVATQMNRLRVAPSAEDLAAASVLVVEAVLEEMAVKAPLFATLDAAADPDAILATNTSALSVAAIAANTRRPARVIGLHFFNPAPVMRLVEVVAHPAADREVVDRAMELMTAWAKTPVRCADSPGFIVNRVNRPFTLEALRILESGLAGVSQLDAAARAAGYPMGPFELMDLVGIDVNLAAALGLYEGFGDEPRFRPSPIQERLVNAGTLGRKTGRGFYRYDDSGQVVGVSLDLPVDSTEPPAQDLVDRLTLGIVNEAYRALGEGVASAADIDLALKLGAGHPLGPFERVKAMGGPATVAERLAVLEVAHGSRFAPAPALRAAASDGSTRQPTTGVAHGGDSP
jgi:3-hydroxybutyryl-CoA dehydrogenase